MMFPQQEQENVENENEYCKNAMISTKKSTVKDEDNIHGRDYKINSATILTVVLVERNFIVLL